MTAARILFSLGVISIFALDGCGAAGLSGQVASLREDPAPRGDGTRMGRVRREDLTNGTEISAPAYPVEGSRPIVLLGGTAEQICYRVELEDATVFLLQADVDERIARLRDDAHLSILAHDSLADLEGGKPWPAPNVSHAEVRNVSSKVTPGESYVTASGRTAKHTATRHSRYDVCVPTPPITPTSKYLSLMALPANGKKVVLVWELTD